MTDRALRGLGVSPGIAWAPAAVIRTDFPEVPDRTIRPDEVDAEVARLHAAAAEVVAELDQLRLRVLQRAGEEESRIFDAQILMAEDGDALAGVEGLIRQNLLSAETAYEFKALELRQLWQGSPSAALRDRLADLNAIQLRMLARLMGRGGEQLWKIPEGEAVVIVARELSPGLTVQLDREHVVGLVSEEGTRTSHAAILAHSLGIPAVMGVPGALARVREGQLLLLDGSTGEVVVAPTRAELDEARGRVARRAKLEAVLTAHLREPTRTPDGRDVLLRANIDIPDEIDLAVRYGAEGVGLLRTEFLLTGRAQMPTEDEQVAYFRRVAGAFHGHPVTIRSYDLGGDKFPAAFRTVPEPNPMLGWRSIRVCLDEPEVFRTQLRAVLRVNDLAAVEAVRGHLAAAAAALVAEGVPAAATVPVGVMVETPAAVQLADALAQHVDFLSVGTNDLTQYTLAVDRGNARLAGRFSSFHPSIVRQLHRVAEAAAAHGVPVSVCGELASEPLGALLLVGLGYTELSVGPPSLPLVKWVVRSVPWAEARAAAHEALVTPRSAGVEGRLRQLAGRHVDLALLDGSAALPLAERNASLRAGA